MVSLEVFSYQQLTLLFKGSICLQVILRCATRQGSKKRCKLHELWGLGASDREKDMRA